MLKQHNPLSMSSRFHKEIAKESCQVEKNLINEMISTLIAKNYKHLSDWESIKRYE